MYRYIPHIIRDNDILALDNTIEWQFEEKINGFHLRVIWNNGSISFRAKNDIEQIPRVVFSTMMEVFNIHTLANLIAKYTDIILHVIFKQIANIPFYFIIDVQIDSRYTTIETVRLIAARLDIKTPPLLGISNINYIKHYLSTYPISLITTNKLSAIVGRSKDLIMQISVKDVKKLKD